MIETEIETLRSYLIIMKVNLASHCNQAQARLTHLFFEKDTEPYARTRDAQVQRLAKEPWWNEPTP